jgi:hypothetical protein
MLIILIQKCQPGGQPAPQAATQPRQTGTPSEPDVPGPLSHILWWLSHQPPWWVCWALALCFPILVFFCQSLPLQQSVLCHITMLSLSFFLLFVCGTGAWNRGLHLEPLHQPFFVIFFFFEIGSHKLFAWAGFEPSSSWVARITSISHWHQLQTSSSREHVLKM